MTAQAEMPNKGLSFLWAELTNTCNESCSHCYNDSGPHRHRERIVSVDNWKAAISSAAKLGCQNLQFIGGEPMTDPALPELIRHARQAGLSFIEVSTNATLLSQSLLQCFVENDVKVAVSLYSHDAGTHDDITHLRGSHAKTVAALKAMHAAGISLRVNVVAIVSDEEEIRKTQDFVNELGIQNVSVDRVRGFGRGEQLVQIEARGQETELCGQCWNGKACILPNGDVVPCIMSRDARLGSILQLALEDIVDSERVREVRQGLFERVYLPKVAELTPSTAAPADRLGDIVACTPVCCEPVKCDPVQCFPVQCHPVRCNPV